VFVGFFFVIEIQSSFIVIAPFHNSLDID
jgi:hypothetical protein